MEKRILTGRNGEADIEVTFEEIDFIGAADKNALLTQVSDMKFIKAKKEAVVTAWPAKLGEKVVTRPGVIIDGKEYSFDETEITVSQKDVDNKCMLVRNPDGEVYMVKGEKFEKLYEKVDDTTYKTAGDAKSFVTTTKDICFKASWGEMQYSPKGSKLCVSENGDIYSITNMAFQTTYKEVEQEAFDEDETEL